MRALTPLGALLLLALPPLAAQQPAPPPRPRVDSMPAGMPRREMMGHMGDMAEMMAPMMRAMAFNPEHLLQRKDDLQLTQQQVTRLTALRDEAKKAHDPAAAEAKTHLEALTKAMQSATPDTSALKQHYQAAQTAMSTAHWVMLKAAAQARGVLNEAQRGRVDGWVDSMQMRRGMRGHPAPDREQ